MIALLLLACATPEDSAAVAAPVDYAAAGAYGASRHTWQLTDSTTARTFPVEVWAPAAEKPSAAEPISSFLSDPEQRGTFDALLAASPEGCPSNTSDVAYDAPPADGEPWPLVVVSHCHGCTRFSTASVAAHLASRGFVVVAPDHVGDTLFDTLGEGTLPLDKDTLALREADLEWALDAALAGELGVAVDATRVGAFGHSFGAVTVGKQLQDRLGGTGAPIAAMFVGAPPENPLLPGVDAAALDAPVLFLRLMEDHSVGTAGNLLMDANFQEVPGPAWELDMADAGHWSPSDLVGLTEDFMPGCGADTRESGGADFTYLDPARGRALTASTAAAFFDLTLNGAASGGDWLAAGSSEIAVTTR